MISKLFKWVSARIVAAIAFTLPLAAMAVTTTGYEDFGDTAGVILWRGTESHFHASTVIDVAEGGSLGEPYAMTANNSATSWQRFARGQTAYASPGKVLVYDTPGTGDGYKYNPDCTFTPLSFGGMWVKVLAINGQPFSILGNNAGKRYTEFGASDKSTLFKFDASFTINRTSTTTFFGEATVDIAQDATFTAQADSNYGVEVDSAATLKLKGAGTLAVTTMNVAGTLDLSATTRPTIAGNVTLGGTIILPAGTEVSPGSPFTVCSGTLSAANVNVKIGDAEAVVKHLTTSGGAITALGDPVYEYTENYPTLVPAGQVYTFIGGETAEAATTASVVTVNGTLKTRGYISLSGLTTAKESMLEVVDGTATVTASAAQSLTGDITIDAGATMINAMTADALNYGWAEYIHVYGTLDMGSTRWTVGSNARIYLYEGGLITGAGQGSNGAIDITSANVRVIASGDSTISANMRVRAENIPVEATEGKTLTISGLINDGVGYSQPGSITKQNSGTLVLTTAPTFTKALKLEAGTLELGGAAASASVTVAASAGTVAASSGSTLTGDLTFVAHVPSSANKALIASESFTGKVILTGDYGSSDPVSLAGLGNAVTLKDFTGFLNQGWDATNVKITIEGTFTQNNGWSGSASDVTQNAVYIAELLGDGTMTQSGAQKQSYIVGNIANFTGTFNFANSRIKSNNNAVLDKAQTVATLTVANTLTVNGGSLTGNLVASNVAVTLAEVPETNLLVPVSGTVSVTGTVTLNGEAVEFTAVNNEGIYKFVPPAEVTITIPTVANATPSITVGGEPGTITDGACTVPYGSAVVVTYTAAEGYTISGGEYSFTATESVEIDTSTTSVKEHIAWIYDENDQLIGSPYTVELTAVGDFLQYSIGNSIKFKAQSTYHDMLIAVCTYDETTFTYTRIPPPPTVATITVGTKVYEFPSLSNAVAQATAGDTIVLVADDTVSFASGGQILIDKALTIDGAGFTVYGKSAWTGAEINNVRDNKAEHPELVHAIKIAGSGDVTIKNLVLTEFADATWCNTGCAVPIMTDDDYSGKLTLDGVNISKYNRDAVRISSGTFEITNCVMTCNGANMGSEYVVFQQGVTVRRTASGTIVDTTVTGFHGDFTAEEDVYEACGILSFSSGDVNVVDCTVTGGTSGGSYQGAPTAIDNAGGGTVAISGGTINAQTAVQFEGAGTTTISSGSFTGALEKYETATGALAISGGTYSVAVDPAYCVEGFEPMDNGDGTYTVSKSWIYEKSGYNGFTGTWSKDLTYDVESHKAAIEDGNTYTAARPSDGRFVTLNMTLSFDGVNDDDTDLSGAKAAVRLGEVNNAYVFQLATTGTVDNVATQVWANATGFSSIATDADYTFLFVLDLTNKTYTASVITDAGATTNALSVAGSPTIAFANYNLNVAATAVREIEFIGSGTLTSIFGSYEDPELVVEFTEDQIIGEVTLTAAQAAWLNGQDNFAALSSKLGTMTQTALDNAYLLNLDVTSEQYDGTFSFDVTGIDLGDDDVKVSVKLTRKGALDGGIIGTLKLKGGSALPTSTFTVLQEVKIDDAKFAHSDEAECTFTKDDTTVFYQPVIE